MPVGFPGIGNGGIPTNIANANLTGTTTATGPLYVADGLIGASVGTFVPLILSTKPAFPSGVTILTTGTPADIATIAIPAGVTRWRPIPGPSSIQVLTMFCETAAASLGGANVELWDGPNGTGKQIGVTAALPANANAITNSNVVTAVLFSTSQTVYIHQTTNSVNAGTCSFYATIVPIL